MNDRFAHELPFGATLLEDGHTRFRLWAPAQRTVHVALDGAAPVPMRPAAAGWHELTVPCGAGTRYHYVLQDGARVPDPASRFQPDDVHGPSCVVDPRAYRWRHGAWRGRPWRETVLYEVHVGLCGGYAGVAALLPELAALGITAIELMPLADFAGGRNWGYDGVLPYAPDAAYGDGDGLKHLVDVAHGHGLMVFLDVVYNHFGPDGNHLQRYAPQFFRAGCQTPWGDAIDFRRTEVREFFVHNALYWLVEYRIDGLRFDAVHAISESGFLDALAERVRDTLARAEPGRQLHLVLENEHNAAAHLERNFDAQWNDDFHNALHVLLTGEHEGYYANYADAPAAHLARCLAEGFAYQGEPSPGHGGAPRGTPSAHLPPTAFVGFLQNHDQVGNRALGERLTALAEPAALRAARVLLLLAPHVPLLFMGEEWGVTTPFLFFTDFHGELAAAVRDGRRREMRRFAAFADPAAAARIPDPNAAATFEASRPDWPAARARGRRCHDEHRRLLQLRHEHIVPRLQGARSDGATALSDAAVRAAWRLGDGALLVIAVNFDAAPLTLAAPAAPPLHATAPCIGGRLPGRAAIAWLLAP